MLPKSDKNTRIAIQKIRSKLRLGLLPNRLLATDADADFVSADLVDWVAGTTDEIEVADDGDGSITIGLVDPLIVGKGGTGAATLTDHGLLLGSGTSALTALAVASNGQLPIGSTGVDPVLATLTGTEDEIDVTNGAGSITLSLAAGVGDIAALTPTDGNFIVGDGTNWITESGATARTSLGLGTGDSPVFTGMTITGNSVFGLNSSVFQPTADSTTFFQIKDKDGNNEFTVDTSNDALLFGYTKLGTIQGSYNFINGSAFASKSGYTHCVAVGSGIANSATGNVYYNNLVGFTIANSATGNVYRNNLVGSVIANNATGAVTSNNMVGSTLANSAATNVYRNNMVGYALASSATGDVYYNNLVGSDIASSAIVNVSRNNLVGSTLASSATGTVTNNNMVGSTLASSATGNVTNTTLYGLNIANNITDSIDSTFAIGAYNLYNTTNETDLVRVVAFPYEALRESSASDLDDACAIGYRAGYQNTKNNPFLLGREASADADRQMVLGSDYYTGGIKIVPDVNCIGDADIIGDLTAGTVRSDDGVSGTLELDDGTTEKITLVFTGGILTSRTVAATTGSVLADWTD